jgi:hypothetical protein
MVWIHEVYVCIHTMEWNGMARYEFCVVRNV